MISPYATRFVLWIALVIIFRQYAAATEPITLESVVAPKANSADEPLLMSFSKAKAADFLDSASLTWQKRRKCFTCHTNYAYLFARPSIGDSPAHSEVRKFAEVLVTDRWESSGPRWDAEVVATAAALAYNDAATTKTLHETTRTALDRMWTVQRKDGGWSWLKCDWPPMESDDHYGVTLAAIAAGVAPEGYARSDTAKSGLAGIRMYLKSNPAPTLHHEMMVLWASHYFDDLLSEESKTKTIDKLLALQKKDGGWTLATFGDWKRGDASPQDTESSDGYASGFAIFVLRRSGVPNKSPAIQRGVAWLKSHQRESGRWFTRSLHADGSHYISHAGTAFAMMALAECNELK